MDTNNTQYAHNYINSISELEYDYFSEEITLTTKLFFFSYVIVILAGLTGNILSFCVLMRQEIRKTSTAVYLIALSIADTLSLLGGPMTDYVLASELFLGWYWPSLSTLSCKLYMFLYFLNPQMSAWCLVSVTIERIIVIYFPHR